MDAEPLLREIIAYCENTLSIDYPGFFMKNHLEQDGMHYLELGYKELVFGINLQPNSEVKLTFCFYNALSEEEANYWRNRGEYKVLMSTIKYNYNHLLGVHKLTKIIDGSTLQTVFYRYVDTMVKFKRDFRLIVLMVKCQDNIELVQRLEDKARERRD